MTTPSREAEDAPDACVPVGRPEHPEEIGGQRIAIARQLPVLLPDLRIAVMGEVLDLIEIARIKQDEAEQPPEDLVELLRPEHGRVTELVLARVEEVDQDAMRDEEGNRRASFPT